MTSILPEIIEHFKNLLKIDTSNPPGNELAAALYLKDAMEKDGINPFIQETAQNRGNLVVRIKGNGQKQPLLISSHLDVVTAELSKWKHPPFSAIEDDGYIYGRGTIDMKNFTAMCLAVILSAKRQAWPLQRDIIMCAVSDEERGGHYGMRSLVKNHPDLIRAEYALGEIGAATNYIGQLPIYPIQVGEKGILWLKTSFEGNPGHGSIPGPNNVHWQVATFLNQLHRSPFPQHLTHSFLTFAKALQTAKGPVSGLPLTMLRSPFAAKILKAKSQANNKESANAAAMLAMITNTVNPTGLKSGKQHNVVPSQVELNLDCRIIPGCDQDLVIREIEMICQQKLSYEVIEYQPGYESKIATPLFELMKKTIQSHHPGSVAIPMLTVGFTDAAQLQQLGITCYGYTPVKLPPGVNFAELYHGHNERIPVAGFTWGTNVFIETVKTFCC